MGTQKARSPHRTPLSAAQYVYSYYPEVRGVENETGGLAVERIESCELAETIAGALEIVNPCHKEIPGTTD